MKGGESLQRYLEIVFSDRVYRVKLDYIKGLYASRLGRTRDDYMELTELFFNDDKFVVNWVSCYLDWDDLKEWAFPVREVPSDYNEEWVTAPKEIIEKLKKKRSI